MARAIRPSVGGSCATDAAVVGGTVRHGRDQADGSACAGVFADGWSGVGRHGRGGVLRDVAGVWRPAEEEDPWTGRGC
jgi:hypothetical protein